MSPCPHVVQLNERVVVAEQLVSAVQAGSAAALCQQARHVVSAVLAALRSPLAAPRLAPLYLRLRPALLPGHALLGDTVARVALRYPMCTACTILMHAQTPAQN